MFGKDKKEFSCLGVNVVSVTKFFTTAISLIATTTSHFAIVTSPFLAATLCIATAT